jgi:hypothetical protein
MQKLHYSHTTTTRSPNGILALGANPEDAAKHALTTKQAPHLAAAQPAVQLGWLPHLADHCHP